MRQLVSLNKTAIAAVICSLLLSNSSWMLTRDSVVMAATSTTEALAKVDQTQPSDSVGFQTNPISNSLSATFRVFLPLVAAPEPAMGWPMAGANPQRTSWTAEEVTGQLRAAWFRPIEPYIPAKVQIIAAYDTLYVSTAKGLYALNANTGAQKWVYPTDMPLGNSPTINNGVAYVGGFDNQLHAVNAYTGQKLWTFKGGGGFDTNPVVIGGLVLLGGRDGYFYAVHSNESASKGTLAWKYKTGGPIHFSAAAAPDNRTIYFASNDGHAYALAVTNGQLLWKSAKLPSEGFYSWWPVVNGDVVILSATRAYRYITPPQVNTNILYTLREPGLPDYGYTNSVVNGAIDARPEISYFTAHPSMKSYYVLNRTTGQETSILPARSLGTHSGTRYPAAVGPDGRVYTVNAFSSSVYGQGVASWSVGATSIRPVNKVGITAHDEPIGFAMGGNTIYFNQCCDRSSGFFNIQSGVGSNYFAYNLDSLIPGYDVRYLGSFESNAVAVFGGWNGVYGVHGDQNPPIPYKGKVYMHRSNAIIAWSPAGGATALPLAPTVSTPAATPAVDNNELNQKLSTEIQKILDAGHLRPGFGVEAGFSRAGMQEVGDNLSDYWSSPADTIAVLSSAYPYLSTAQQTQLRTYLKQEMTNYSPCAYTHIGWNTGASREYFDLPPEVQAALGSYGPTMYSAMGFPAWTGPDWHWQPQSFYALWKYAANLQLTPTEIKAFFTTSCRGRLTSPPSDTTLAAYPFAHNAWISGYRGYMELEKLAGEITSITNSSKYATYQRLLSLRAANFTKDNPWGPDAKNHGQGFGIARNFVHLTPEVGQYLHDNAFAKVQTAFNEYENVAPYWFVTRFEAAYDEQLNQHLYDYAGMFAAKALIFGASRAELARYLDVPAFARGDLFYIQNLVYTLRAQ